MLVPKLIEAIRAGSAEGKEAALVLGLLIERENVYHPIPGDEGGIGQVLGEEFVSRRLSKIEVKEAVDGLIDYINEAVVPQPRAVWALTKSYEPRTLPHLINVLDRFVGDAQKEELVYQALVGIMNSSPRRVLFEHPTGKLRTDERSLSAIRRAAREGHGRVREAAIKYLQRNLPQLKRHFAAREELKYVKKPDQTFGVEGQITMLQRRPGHSHIVVNDRYQGIRVLDPKLGTEVQRVAFAEGYDRSGIINGWCLRSDGDAVLVLHEKSRTASLLSLTSNEPSYDLPAPPLPKIADLRYIWEDNSFWLTGGNSFAFFNLLMSNGRPTFVKKPSIRARRAHRAWCKALDELQVLTSEVLRVETDKKRLIYYDSTVEPEQIGVLTWRQGLSSQRKWSLPLSEYVPVMAFHKERMFLMYDNEVHAINQKGSVEAIYLAPEGFYCCGLDILPAPNAALVLACSPPNHPTTSQILLYRLDEHPTAQRQATDKTTVATPLPVVEQGFLSGVKVS